MEEKEEQVDAEILEPFELHFSDLILLSSSSTSYSSKEELERLESISRTVMQTLGPSGPGLLAITGAPKASELRQSLLPLARKLALLSNEDRRRILKEHDLGSDVSLKNPDRSVSSFALQLEYMKNLSSDSTFSGSVNISENNSEHPKACRSLAFDANEFKNLGNIFKELGVCMMELGLRLAHVCDRVIGGQELEQNILDSCRAKGRLIHYHSSLDNLILKEAERTKGSSKKPDSHHYMHDHEPRESDLSNNDKRLPGEDLNKEICGNEPRSHRTSVSNLWQQWHYDYGIFTVLTAPMFISPCHPPTKIARDGLCSSCERELPSPDGHTYLQIFDPTKNTILLIRSPPDRFIIQVGESADILSKGSLRSTLHSVCRPMHLENLSRETFVVFLQPSWNKIFSMSESHKTNLMLGGQCSRSSTEVHSSSDSISSHQPERELPKIAHKISKVVPPLSSRLKDGMTFAEFSRETTKQYYGSSGMQSKR